MGGGWSLFSAYALNHFSLRLIINSHRLCVMITRQKNCRVTSAYRITKMFEIATRTMNYLQRVNANNQCNVSLLSTLVRVNQQIAYTYFSKMNLRKHSSHHWPTFCPILISA